MLTDYKSNEARVADVHTKKKKNSEIARFPQRGNTQRHFSNNNEHGNVGNCSSVPHNISHTR